jgi:hypothetical protein
MGCWVTVSRREVTGIVLQFALFGWCAEGGEYFAIRRGRKFADGAEPETSGTGGQFPRASQLDTSGVSSAAGCGGIDLKAGTSNTFCSRQRQQAVLASSVIVMWAAALVAIGDGLSCTLEALFQCLQRNRCNITRSL